MEGSFRRFSPSDHPENDDEDDSSQSSKTFFDRIQQDGSETAYRDLISSKSGNRSRKSFNDRLRLSRSSSARSQIPASDISFGSRRFHPSASYPDDDYVVECDRESCTRISMHQSSLRHPSDSNAVENPEEHGSEFRSYTDLSSSSGRGFGGEGRGRLLRSSSMAMVEKEEEPAEPPVRMSLMALLEETDRQAGVVGSMFFGFGEEEEEEEESEAEEEADGVEHVCCVCMVRHKGVAFITCGHSFCRLCSKELSVSRGNCPLCNGYIMEILDIF